MAEIHLTMNRGPAKVSNLQISWDIILLSGGHDSYPAAFPPPSPPSISLSFNLSISLSNLSHRVLWSLGGLGSPPGTTAGIFAGLPLPSPLLSLFLASFSSFVYRFKPGMI